MHLAKRFAVTILGVALLVVGVVLMILPGPGILLIVAGLAVLATEYVWARRLLVKAKGSAQKVQQEAVSSPLRTAASVVFALGMVVVGVLMLTVDEVSWPIAEGLLDAVWKPVTGGILVVTGLVLVGTTYITWRTAKQEPTTHTARTLDPDSRGSTRFVA